MTETMIDPKLKTDHINERLIVTDQKDIHAGSIATAM
jgi:hypothetical protein